MLSDYVPTIGLTRTVYVHSMGYKITKPFALVSGSSEPEDFIGEVKQVQLASARHRV